ncbi:response regulator [Roseicella sp. DB1501]|uniref:response regulator n=1 Tax=Roseicella sp. DB1501 TaxID=2730925 RepID=UPI0014909173|nr:response regulator [Roseicella sp. DB1501]NOG68920.1 response regulator [Roseicella sp. DB1501]
MRVLLIEDDALVRNLLSETLDGDGFEVDGLANAEDALILLGAGQVPDVLVADINLGAGLNGFDLAEMARARHPDVEVILISGAAPEPARRNGGRREHFLQKPFAPDRLAAMIREAGAARGAEQGC